MQLHLDVVPFPRGLHWEAPKLPKECDIYSVIGRSVSYALNAGLRERSACYHGGNEEECQQPHLKRVVDVDKREDYNHGNRYETRNQCSIHFFRRAYLATDCRRASRRPSARTIRSRTAVPNLSLQRRRHQPIRSSLRYALSHICHVHIPPCP